MGVGIEFLILGPLDVRVDAQRVSVGGPKQRALLSLLLLSANHVVSVHQLIDNLWDDDPPATATAQVHRRVSELRRLLRDAPGAGPDELIVTRPPGYAMLLRPEQLDLFRFQEAAALAREAAGRGEPELAAGTLRSALALWRGDALGDVDVPAVRAEAVRLENLRLAALEARIDADLALGRQVEAAADLEALVAGHPYRERFRVQLVVALWRLGRRAEALDVQADTRRVLGELGLDPGPVLDELEEAPPPALPPGPFFGGPDTGRPHVVPRQLPPDIGDFVGRERQAEGLVALLRGDGEEARSGRAPVAVIAGPSGIGKTTLAVRVGHQLAEHFPDGQLYAQLRGRGNRPADPGEVLGSFLRALGVDGQLVPGDVDERAARFRTLLAGRRVLVVLDDACDSVQVRPLLPAASGCAVLVTSQPMLGDLPGARHLELGPFTSTEAVSLLASVAGKGRVLAEWSAAREVVRSCGNLPLAIRIAGARLATRPAWPVRTMAELLEDAQSRLDVLQYGELALRTTFEVSYHALSDRPQDGLPPGRVFRLLGFLDSHDVDRAAAAAALGEPASRVERALELLVDARLLDSPRHGRYRYHDLMRIFASDLASQEDAPGDLHAVLDRAVRWYLAVLQHVNAQLRPGRLVPYGDPWPGLIGLTLESYGEVAAWLNTERRNMVALACQAASSRAIPAIHTACLVAHLSGHLEVRGHWSDWERIACAALAAAGEQGDRHAAALARHELALLACHRDRAGEARAMLCSCLEAYREARDGLSEVRCLSHLGVLALIARDHADAAGIFRQALELCRALGIRRGESGLLHNLGVAVQHQGHWRDAIASYEASLAIHRETGNQHGEATTLTSLGAAHRELGDAGRAVVCLEEALRICQACGNVRWQAAAKIELAALHRAAGRGREAAVHTHEAVRLLRPVGNDYATATALREMATSLDHLGRHLQARACGLEALAILESLDAPEAATLRRWLYRDDAARLSLD